MKKLLLPALLAFLFLMSAVAQADIGKQEAVSIAQKVYPGRVLSVKQVQSNQGPVYEVKTLSTGGDVKIVVVDANTGRVISKP